MDRSCENCRFCIYARSMRGKEEPYCERHSKWIGYTILCSEWEMVSVPKPKTNADRFRSMSDEELAEWFAKHNERSAVCPNFGAHDCQASCRKCWLDWLKQEAGE